MFPPTDHFKSKRFFLVLVKHENICWNISGCSRVEWRPTLRSVVTWHLTPDTGHLTTDTWHVKHDTEHTGGGEHCLNVWEWQSFEEIVTKDDWLTCLINNEGVEQPGYTGSVNKGSKYRWTQSWRMWSWRDSSWGVVRNPSWKTFSHRTILILRKICWSLNNVSCLIEYILSSRGT